MYHATVKTPHRATLEPLHHRGVPRVYPNKDKAVIAALTFIVKWYDANIHSHIFTETTTLKSNAAKLFRAGKIEKVVKEKRNVKSSAMVKLININNNAIDRDGRA
jgi:hypothetical protein